MRSLKIVVAIIAVLFLLTVVGLYSWLQTEHFQNYFSRKASDAIGREVTLDAPIDIEFGLPPRLRISGFRIANSPWGRRPHFAYLQGMDIAPRLMPLIRGDIVLDVLKARDGEVWFEKKDDIGWNIPASNASDSDTANETKPFFRLKSIGSAEISNVRLAKGDDPDDGVMIQQLESRGSRGAYFTGIVDERPLELEWESNTNAWLLAEENLHELEVKAVYDGSPFSGEVTVDTGKSPVFISGKIHSPEFKHKSRSDSDSSNPIPDQHLFTTWLEFFDADIQWTLDKFVVGKLDATEVNGRTRVENAELRIYPASGRLGDGRLQFSIVLAAPVDQPSLRVTGQMDGYNLSERLDLFQPSQSGDGRIDIRFEVHGVGDNIRKVAATLDGELQLVMSQARISNRTLQRLTSDLGSLLDPFSEAEGSTPVRCMAIRLGIEDGMANVDQMVMDTRDALITGKGVINLKTGQIDILLLPDGRGIALTKLQLPIRISGPLGHPDADAQPTAILQRTGSEVVETLIGKGGLFDEPLRRRFSNSGEGCNKTLEAYGVGKETSD